MDAASSHDSSGEWVAADYIEYVRILPTCGVPIPCQVGETARILVCCERNIGIPDVQIVVAWSGRPEILDIIYGHGVSLEGLRILEAQHRKEVRRELAPQLIGQAKTAEGIAVVDARKPSTQRIRAKLR